MDWPAIWEIALQFKPPYFFGTLAATAFGAFAGAWANSRIQTKKAVIEELNNLSAAWLLSMSIFNRSIALKRQYIKPMHAGYEIARREYEKAVAAKALHDAGPVNRVLRTDLQTINPPKMPTEALERYVFERISLRGRALAAAVELVGAIDALGKAITWRNEFIAEVQKASPMPPKVLAEKYFGLKTADGVTDERFRSNVSGILMLTDDCIFFSQILAEDLQAFSNNLRKRHARRLRLGLPKFYEADASLVERSGLLPSRASYEPWLRGFRVIPSRWKRLSAAFRTAFRQMLDRASRALHRGQN